jgi:Ribonuclease G/E
VKVLKITTHWTTQEAAEVYEALDLLKTAVWESYGNDIREMYINRAQDQKEISEQFNDDMDF